MIDAGSKSLTSDLLGLQGYGHVVEFPDAAVAALSEEHGILRLNPLAPGPVIGQQIHIIPNHACPVSNLVDRVYLHRSGVLIGPQDVTARGCVT